MRKTLKLHPFLFAIFPILFLYSNNADQLSLSATVLPLASSLIFTIAVLSVGIIIKETQKTGILTSIFLILFFSYGHFYELLKGVHLGELIIGRHLYLFILWIVVFATVAFLIIRTLRNLESASKVLNMVAIVLVVIPTLKIGYVEFKKIADKPALKIKTASAKEATADASNPDIYYIILDAYISETTLKELYKYDNTDFLGNLRDKGFFVASESNSNYAQTWLSLTSSLNMEYINYLKEKYGTDYRTWVHNEEKIKNSRVLNFLKRRGYRTIHIDSGYTLTDGNENADMEINCDRLDEFTLLLIKTTALSRFEESLVNNDIRRRVLCSFKELAGIPKIKGPKFVFAHIVSPHPPNVFGLNGEPVRKAALEEGGNDWEKNYLNQLIYINKKVEALTDEIISNSENPPIIIIQGDHGSLSTFQNPDNTEKKDSGWKNPTDENIKERMRILNAYYLPQGKKDLLYESITPVNTFRLIFDAYFGADFELLKDQNYFSTYAYPYGFKNVTDIVDYE